RKSERVKAVGVCSQILREPPYSEGCPCSSLAEEPSTWDCFLLGRFRLKPTRNRYSETLARFVRERDSDGNRVDAESWPSPKGKPTLFQCPSGRFPLQISRPRL